VLDSEWERGDRERGDSKEVEKRREDREDGGGREDQKGAKEIDGDIVDRDGDRRGRGGGQTDGVQRRGEEMGWDERQR
jgi:hypothetical protein